MIYSVALDGPGGAGKSTVARRIAEKRGIVYVDTGAMYRAVALFMLEKGIDMSDAEAVKKRLSGADIEIAYSGGLQRIFLCGKDVSREIRRPRVSMAASAVSAYGPVRAFLLESQRDMARRQSVIMDGRDIGTVVLPGARVKIFLTADSRVRAERRYKELLARGEKAELSEVLADMEKRDRQDANRANAPLKRAEDAVVLDTSGMDFDRVVDRIMEIIDEKIGK